MRSPRGIVSSTSQHKYQMTSGDEVAGHKTILLNSSIFCSNGKLMMAHVTDSNNVKCYSHARRDCQITRMRWPGSSLYDFICLSIKYVGGINFLDNLMNVYSVLFVND